MRGSIFVPAVTFTFRTVTTIASLLVAGAMIVAAYIFSGVNALQPNAANAGVTDDLLKAYAEKDSDADLLPDWQEALYGTNPNNVHTVDPKLSDKEAVDKGLVKPKYSATPAPAGALAGKPAAPGTITEAFSQELFKQYLLSGGSTAPTKEEVAKFVQGAIASLEQSQRITDAYTIKNEVLTGDGEALIRAYATQAEKVIRQTPSDTAKSEVDYISDLITKNDATAGSHILKISKAYTAAAAALIKVPVPASGAAAHLKIANALARMGDVMENTSTFSTDPLRGMLGLSEYEKSAAGMVSAFAEAGTYFDSKGISFTNGQPGYIFYLACTTSKKALQKPTP